jgi:hypothetical protein
MPSWRRGDGGSGILPCFLLLQDLRTDEQARSASAWIGSGCRTMCVTIIKGIDQTSGTGWSGWRGFNVGILPDIPFVSYVFCEPAPDFSSLAPETHFQAQQGAISLYIAVTAVARTPLGRSTTFQMETKSRFGWLVLCSQVKSLKRLPAYRMWKGKPSLTTGT